MLAVLAATVALTACVGAPASHPTPTPRATSVTVPSAIPNDPALRADVAMTSCAAAKGGWSARGTISNSTVDARDYRITVLFTSSQATVIGTGTTMVRVAPGAHASWRIAAGLTPASPTLCVLSGVA